MYTQALGLLGLFALTSASPANKSPTVPKCTDFIIPITASAPVKLIHGSKVPKNLDDPTVFEDYVASEASSGLAALLATAGTHETTGTFQMSARYCEPAKFDASRKDTIQYLQHAITMTKNYWNGLAYPDGIDGKMYAYTDVASSYGYPTIAIDNLGSGNSSHPDPFAVVQMSLQVAIIHKIITGLREGTIGGPLKDRSFKKVIYAGHSYGSICGNALATEYPNAVDAYVLTGYSGEFINGLVPLAAGIAQPASTVMTRFAGLSPGYLAQSVESGRVYGLYTVDNVGGFSPAVAQFDFDHEGTVAFYGVGPADSFKGSMFVLTGKNDAIVCNEPTGADCGEGKTSKPATAGKFFPNAKDYTYHIPDKTGHNANMHYSSPESFQLIHQYLTKQGF